MKQLKKTILTLVALLAVTTGAWADETLLLTIESKDYTTFLSGSKTFDDKVTVTFSNFVYYDGEEGWYADGDPSVLTVAGTNGYTITSCKFYTANGEAETGYTIEGKSPSVYLSASTEVYTDANQSVEIGYQGITKIEVYGTAPSAASSGPKVAWDKDKKSGSFTMPGGNVTLEPEYFPQATAAEGAVTAAGADARATTDDPLVKVDATKLTGAKKLMYFVSNSGTNAPAYDAEGWTDQLPTAEKFKEAGNVYVWYYPVGTDEGDDGATATYSDGDICLQSITARIAAAPTYAVTFAEGTEESDKWKADPATGVKKDETVTVTYTGSKKVIGVKAEKKAAEPALKPLANATAEDLGKIAGADGNIYDTKDAAEAAGTTAVAMIAYVGTASDCAHGLAIALADESGTKEYGAAGPACSGKAAVTGGTWRLPSIKDWQYMFIGCGASGSYSASPSSMSYSGLASKLTTAQGDALQADFYWSSTEYDPDDDGAWSVRFDSNPALFCEDDENESYRVRACLAF